MPYNRRNTGGNDPTITGNGIWINNLPGSVTVTFDSTRTDKVISSLTDIPSGTSLSITNNALTASGFSSLSALTGNLNLSGNSISTIEIPSFNDLNGQLRLTGNLFSSLGGLANLITIAGLIDTANNVNLTISNYPNLVSISGTLTHIGGFLTDTELNSLTTITGTINFSSNRITTISFNSLVNVSGNLIYAINLLTSASFAQLQSINHLDLSQNFITNFSFPLLATISGLLDLSQNALDQNAMDTLIHIFNTTITVGQTGSIDTRFQTGGGDAAMSPDYASLVTKIIVIT